MKGSKRSRRALGHTKADLALHLHLDHRVSVADWRACAYATLSKRHNDAHDRERAK